MTINFFQSLSYKLTRTSLVAVLVIGLLVTFFQIYLDFQDQSQSIKKSIDDIIVSSRTSAQRAVHTLDTTLAAEVVKGIATYPFMQSVEILDEDGNQMASFVNPMPPSRSTAITSFLMGKASIYKTKLFNTSDIYEGALIIIVNNDVMFRPLYQRAVYTLVSGIIRNTILGIILSYLFNLLLSKPLNKLASNIALTKNADGSQYKIPHIDEHLDDEIGFIIDSANELIQQLDSHQRSLAAREQQLRIILDASPNQVFAIDQEGKFVFANITTSQFYGLGKVNLSGQNYYEIHRRCCANETKELFNAIKSIERSNEAARDIEQTLTDVANRQHVVNMSLMPFSLNDMSCILVIASDISERVAAEERVERMAYYDALTGLPNRNQLYEILIDHISTTKRNNCEGAVLFIDIDDFKRINDTLGHSIGDDLLLVLSNKMRAVLRSSEVLARLGGDEFILSIPNISGDNENAANHAANMAKRLLNVISAPIELSGHFFSIGASIGISTYPTVAKDTEQVLRFADTAMYQAKAAGRNCYRVFEAPMAEEARARVELESEIRQAINNQEFRFYLQPLIDAGTGRICGAEALIRWEHPEKGLIMPGHFIPYLEQSPMVSQVGAQILDQVCGFVAAGIEQNLIPEGFRISVNVSATEFFQPNFVERTKAALDVHAINGKYIELEITESVALDGLDSVVAKMTELQKHNITFALDDFGTGYSSLNYLKQLPVDKIKIDKTFIDDVPGNKQDTALVAAVIDIAENLNLKIVVEGVEHEHQAVHFAQNEHVIAQGYYFDAPMPASKLVKKYLNM